MSGSNSQQGFPWGTLLFLVIVGIVLRVNLPPASVSAALDLSVFDEEGPFGKFLLGTSAKVVFSDTWAKWQYRDFIILRVATSKRLNATAIGLPFCKWYLFVFDNGDN